jgi:hypothetical protein
MSTYVNLSVCSVEAVKKWKWKMTSVPVFYCSNRARGFIWQFTDHQDCTLACFWVTVSIDLSYEQSNIKAKGKNVKQFNNTNNFWAWQFLFVQNLRCEGCSFSWVLPRLFSIPSARPRPQTPRETTLEMGSSTNARHVVVYVCDRPILVAYASTAVRFCELAHEGDAYNNWTLALASVYSVLLVCA